MRFASLIATFAAVALSTVSAQSGSFTNFTTCGAPNNKNEIANLALSPSPLCIGQKYCLSGSGTLLKPITEGAQLQNTWMLFSNPVPNNYDLCALLAASGQPCPIPAGPFSFNICFDPPRWFPPNFALGWNYKFVDEEGELLSCQNAPLNSYRIPSTPDNYYGIGGVYGINCPAV
ncbi:hypothetical protein BGW39_011831 [Mortierella sp. 14UC]|nr:hypothetical protein BGW39_011831 [Mortierella sp. 14UC]